MQAMAMAREPSMEDILASIKRVIAEEKEIRAAAPLPGPDDEADDDDVLELDESMEALVNVPAADLGPPLLEEEVADESRQRLEELASVAATAPPAPQVNPLEDMVREMLRPILKQWLDDHLPGIVDEHVKREIHRITGRPL
jgi:cell pole-organizing protein PopZ